MKLSTKGRYGLRALAELATHTDEGPMPLANIAKRQNISENYLESMFAALKRAGIIRSVKGARGGYLLAAPAADISAGKVLRALEGDLAIIESDLPESDTKTKSLKSFIEANVWDVVTDKINNAVDSLSLQDLVDQKTMHELF